MKLKSKKPRTRLRRYNLNWTAKQRRNDYMSLLMLMSAREAPPAAPLQEISALETVALVGDGNAESMSLSSSSLL